MRIRDSRIVLALGAALLLAGCGLAGCAGSPGGSPSPSSTPSLTEQLRELDGVVTADGEGTGHLLVSIDPELDDDGVQRVAAEAGDLARAASWDGEVTLQPVLPPRDPAIDLQQPPAWSLGVYPGDPAEVRAQLGRLLEISAVPGVASVGFTDGWPGVLLSSLDEAMSAIETLSARDDFADGATYAFGADRPRLKITHIPERITLEGVAAIVRIAQECAGCDIELASMTTGPRWPQLYVSDLTPEELALVDAQLRDPSLADADPEGYSIPFQLSFVGADGPQLTFGTFGDVPDTRG